MNLPLSYTKGIFVSNMHHWGMGKETKRVWKESEKALQKRERKLGGHSIQRKHTLGRQTEGFGHWHISAQLQQEQVTSLLPSWAEKLLGSPRTAFPTALLLLLPTEGRGWGDTCSWLRGGSRSRASVWNWLLPWGSGSPSVGVRT